MEPYVIIGIVWSIIIIISIYDLIKKKAASQERDKLFKLWKDFEQCDLIPLIIEGSRTNLFYNKHLV